MDRTVETFVTCRWLIYRAARFRAWPLLAVVEEEPAGAVHWLWWVLWFRFDPTPDGVLGEFLEGAVGYRDHPTFP